MHGTLDSLNARRASRWRPPPSPLAPLPFARTLRLPDGPAAGQLWDPATEPAQLAWLAVVASGRWRRLVNVAPSQRGKTLTAILCPWLRTITQLRRGVGYVMPNLNKLEQNWAGKIEPMIRGAGFGAWLPTKGPGSKGGKPSVLTMRDPATGLIAGRSYFMAAGTGKRETAVSSVTTAVILFDEADDAANAGQIELVFRRIEADPDGIAVIASTVNDRAERDAHPILTIHAQGTKSRLHHRCPHCSAYFAPDFEHFDTTRAAITCPHCSVIWSEADRHAALNASLLVHHGQAALDGQVIGPEPTCPTFSLLTTGLDYHMAVIENIAAEYRGAKVAELRGDFSLMRTHMQKVWCRPYVEPEPEEDFDNKSLARMAEGSTVHKRTVPTWAQFLVMTQDVQGDRHYWEVVAYGPDERWAIIDWGYEHLVPREKGAEPDRAPTKADRIRVFDRIRDLADTGWQVEGGDQRMRPVQRGVDCGWSTDEVIAWVTGNPDWKAVRGVGMDEVKEASGGNEKTLPAEIRATKALRAVRPPGWRIYWWKVDGHVFRRSTHAALMRSPDQPGSGMIPHGTKSNDDIALHLTGEIWTEPKEGTKGKPYWREVRKRHDYLDCHVYNMALALLHRYLPDRRDDGDVIPDPPPAPAPPPTGNGGWVESSFDQSSGGWING